MKCDCGHSADHHNPGEDSNFSGNCRNCECPAFTIGSDSRRPGVYSLIARQRGEVIVRRWNDDIETLKAEHAQELAKRDVMLEEQKRLMRISNKTVVDLESRLAGCDEDYLNRINALEEPLKIFVARCKCKGTGHMRVVEPDGNLWEDCERCRWARELLL